VLPLILLSYCWYGTLLAPPPQGSPSHLPPSSSIASAVSVVPPS
jgi:hypothetical protein